MTWFGVTEENRRFGDMAERMRLAWRRMREVSHSDVATVTRTEGQDDVDVTRVDVGHQTGSPAPRSCQLTFSSKLFSSVDYSCGPTPVAF